MRCQQPLRQQARWSGIEDRFDVISAGMFEHAGNGFLADLKLQQQKSAVFQYSGFVPLRSRDAVRRWPG